MVSAIERRLVTVMLKQWLGHLWSKCIRFDFLCTVGATLSRWWLLVVTL